MSENSFCENVVFMFNMALEKTRNKSFIFFFKKKLSDVSLHFEPYWKQKNAADINFLVL